MACSFSRLFQNGLIAAGGLPTGKLLRVMSIVKRETSITAELWAAFTAAGAASTLGISNVTVAQLEVARSITPIVSVQNLYSLRKRTSEDVLAACEGIAFLPWNPLGGKRGLKAVKIKQVASRCGLTHAALSLAWLLAKSPLMLPIPGTQSIDHLEDNVLAAALRLAPEDFDDLR
jgi:aryl-alcohol dehydrogenase-like predicted oxidoreductase